MSGHSKWANIKNRKGAQDKKRSEAFTRAAKNILTAIRLGSGNIHVDANLHLKAAIDKAREVNMPKENIERLIARFEEKKNNLINFTMEGYGPMGVPFVIEIETDNKNRTLGEIKLILKENGGTLGESGSVLFQFSRVGEVELETLPDDKQLELIDMGAVDFEDNVVIVEPGSVNKVADKIGDLGLKVIRAEAVMRSANPIVLNNEDEVGQILDLLSALEENDDVVNVYAGFDYNGVNA